jgi:hypothetical protein
VKVADMNIVIGPVLRRADGYAFDTWTVGKGLTRSYPYRWIDHAYYAQNAEIKASARSRTPAAIVCQTLDEFIVKLTGDGYPVDSAYLAAGNPWLQRANCTPRSGSAIGRLLSAGGQLRGRGRRRSVGSHAR